MKQAALFFALALAVIPASAAPKNYGTITTRSGKSFYECTVVHVHPDGVSFTHRDGAAKIAFKELPANMQREFRYDPKAEAAYKHEQEVLRKEEQKRREQQEIAMQEKLMEAQMAEASYLAAARAAARAATTAPMSTALPGESSATVAYQTPSWVGTPITGPAVGGRDYRRGNYGYWRGYPFGYGGGYYSAGGYYPGASYGYPYGGYYGGGYIPSAYIGPTIFRQWNVGSGIHIGLGVNPFGGGIRLFR